VEITSRLTKARVIAGIDIGGTKIAVGLVDEAGKILARGETPTHVELGPAAATARILEILQAQQQQKGLAPAGIGIGCTGPVDPITGELGDVCTLPGWQWNPVREISQALGVSAAMENDADAAALGEASWGAGKGKGTLICITVGTGIGAGIILNGEVYRGANGSHPELGHFILEPSGPLCTCGAYGCWEALASGPAMEQWYAEQNRTPLSGKEICERAQVGDAAAVAAVEREAKYLALGLATVVTNFMPEAIVLGGSVMRSADLLLGGVKEVLRQNCRLVPYELCEISLASLGPDVGLIGAAQVWHRRFPRG